LLQRIREGISGPIAWAILALLALVFAVWGINMDFTPQTFAVKVNGDEIPAEPIRRAIQNQVAQYQQALDDDLSDELQAAIRDQVVEQAVLERLLAQRTEDEGYRVGDAELGRSISEMPVFQVGGQFSMDSYQARIRAAGYSTEAFEEEQRRRFEIQQLQDAIIASSFVTDDELEAFVRLEEERRETEWVSFQSSEFAGDIEVSEADIEARYGENPELFQTEEQVDIEYIEVRLADVADDVEVSEEELQTYYEAERSRTPELFETDERRRASHILVSVDDDTDEDAALEEARSIVSRIRGGEALEDLAKEFSDDTGSADKGGDLGWVERGMMVQPFEDALFDLEPGALSEPVRSRFGFHVIRVDEIEPGSEKTFEDARAELTESLRQRRAEDLYYDRGEQLASLAFENPDSLVPAAGALGLEPRSVTGVTRSAGDGVAGEADVRAAAFSTDVLEGGENSPVIELADDHAIVLRVTDHRLPELRPLADVRDAIVAELRDEAAQAQLALMADQARERLVAGESAKAIAEDMGGQYHPRESLARTSAGVPPGLAVALFSTPVPAPGEPVLEVADVPGGVAVLRVFSVTPGKLADLDETEREALRERLVRETAGRELNAYLAQLRNEASVVVVDNQIE
jgi:peptidyl-prolyl cis-trans isomerase D